MIFLPMFAVFFGIIDVSMAIFLQSTFTHATREGARFAITFTNNYGGTSCTTSQATCIAQVVQDNAAGFLGGTKSNLITVNYYTSQDLSNPVMSCNSGTCTLRQALPTGISYANQPGNVVEVTVNNYPWNWLFPIKGYSAGTGINLNAASADVLGGLAVGTTVPPNP